MAKAKATAKATTDGMTIKFSKKQSKAIRQAMIDNGAKPEHTAKFLTLLTDISEIRATEVEMYG